METGIMLLQKRNCFSNSFNKTEINIWSNEPSSITDHQNYSASQRSAMVADWRHLLFFCFSETPFVVRN